MLRWASWFVGLVIAAPAVVHAAPVVIATCGDSSLDITPGASGETATLHGVVAAGNRWSFSASIGLVRLGAKTRTITIEDVHAAHSDKPAPSALFVDFLLDDKKVILRHASEGASDPAYAVDLDKCSFTPAGDGALAALVPPPGEPIGCAAEVVRAGYRTQVAQAAKLPDDQADREARALCEDHQKTIEARAKLEAAISDRAARDRVAARGPALLRTEDNRMKAWNRLDSCLSASEPKAHGIAGLHDAEAKTRACYAQIAAKL